MEMLALEVEKVANTSLSLQDDVTRAKIRVRIVKGWDYKEIMEELSINENTWDANVWRNTQGFRDFLVECKKEYFLSKTEGVSKEILNMDTTENAKLLAIKQKEAEFLRETLLKEHGYTKRSEVIGLNVNKTEPLDEEQKAKLDKLLKH